MAAEDVLDGLQCEGCGEWFDDVPFGAEVPGHPRRCVECEPPRRPPPMQRLGSPRPKRTVPCPGCTRKFFTWNGLLQHQTMTGH